MSIKSRGRFGMRPPSLNFRGKFSWGKEIDSGSSRDAITTPSGKLPLGRVVLGVLTKVEFASRGNEARVLSSSPGEFF